MRPTSARVGFTLVEILIVIVVLGILASIVVPQYTDASQDASFSNVRSQLHTIRSQIEIFNAQAPRNGWTAYDALRVAPGDASFWDDLVDENHLQQTPQNPLCPAGEESLVGAAPANVGWVWVDGDLRATDGSGALFVD